MNGYELLENLKAQLSNREYQQYANKIQYDEQNSHENLLIFITDNIFIANWAKRKYKDKMIGMVEQATSFKPEIIFTPRVGQKVPQRPQKKYIFKTVQQNINCDLTFETFIVGGCNEFAYKMTMEAAKRQQP